MINKKFIVFKMATTLALLIATGVFMFLAYFTFNDRILRIRSQDDIAYLSALFFLLLTGIAFQIQNIWLVAATEKEDLPRTYYFKYHTILLVCNALGTVGIGTLLYSMIMDLYSRETNHQPTSLLILWFCTAWFLANLISIIGSLHIRTYLRIHQIRKERASLDDFGKYVN